MVGARRRGGQGKSKMYASDQEFELSRRVKLQRSSNLTCRKRQMIGQEYVRV